MKVGTWSQELKQKSWRNTAYWLTQLGFYLYILLLFLILGRFSICRPSCSLTWRSISVSTYWVLELKHILPSLTSLLSYNTPQDRLPKGGTTQCGLGPPTSLIKKMLYRRAHKPIWWRQFVNWEFPLHSDSSVSDWHNGQHSTGRHLYSWSRMSCVWALGICFCCCFIMFQLVLLFKCE